MSKAELIETLYTVILTDPEEIETFARMTNDLNTKIRAEVSKLLLECNKAPD
jgi:hypothetical protein